MDETVYLVFGKRNVQHRRFKGATVKQPRLQPGERAIRVKVSIPDKFFEPAGVPTARIEVPEDMLSDPVPDVTVEPYEG